MTNEQNQKLALKPLGAGDLIDRAVRLYRQNFVTLIRIAAVPVIVSATGAVLLTVGWRGFYLTGEAANFVLYFWAIAVGLALSVTGNLLTLMVMGGAARNLVRHLLWGEPVTVRETFRSVRARFWSLLGVTLIMAVIVFFTLIIVGYGGLMLIGISFLGATLVAWVSPILAVIVGVVLSAAASLLTVWLFFLIVGKIAYAPQVLLVEGQSVGAAIGRSASLAGGNSRRLAALFVFTSFATYSALMILCFPIFWYAEANNIPLYSFTPDELPQWYSVTLQVIWQLSFILLAPVWMLGLSLLYIDERVRNEAYDIELMAARNLGEMPPLDNPAINPLRPALVTQTPPQFAQNRSPHNTSTLGLR